MNSLLERLYPELAALPVRERESALREARDTPFDMLELLGMAAGLVLVTALTRYGSAGLDVAEQFGAAIVNFAIALPLLAIALAPFLVRRTRRGLRARSHAEARA